MSDVKLTLSRKFVLGEILARQSRKYPDKTALIFGEKRFSYQEFNDRANRLANYLLGKGVKHGDKVGILLFNGNEILEAYFAVNKLGAVAVPVNFRFVAPEIEYILSHSDSSVFIYDVMFTEAVQSLKTSLDQIHTYLSVGSVDGPDTEYEVALSSAEAKEPLIIEIGRASCRERV